MEAAAYTFDPEDPRAPPQDVWDRLSVEQRRRVLEALPSEFSWASPPEGDLHRRSKERAIQALEEHFRRIRRRIYLSAELPVYYPGERVLAPDVIAVLDVEPHERFGWVVSAEGKGLDFALEIHVRGRAGKDFESNVDRFARLGIPEYFAFEPDRGRLMGWRLGSDPSAGYSRIVPQEGRWSSGVLGVDLAVDGRRLTFFHGAAELLDGRGLVDRLSTMVDHALERADRESLRADQEFQRADQESLRAEQASLRAERLAARLRALGIDPDA